MYDLIVVGSGPAGASAARKAAHNGLKTLLIEKERIPRNKLCGGGVTPKVLKLFDFKLPDELVECAPRSARIHGGENCYRFQTDRTIVYMTSRSRFDAFLTERAIDAGAELKDGSPVYRIERTNACVEAKTHSGSFRSKMLIGADGMGGPTASNGQLHDHWMPDEVVYAMESEAYVGEGAVEDFVGEEGFFDIYFGVSPAGYGWVFPKDNHLTVGVGCRLSRLRDARALFDGFVKKIPQLEGYEIPRPMAHLIPLGGATKVPLLTDRILLAGDCAGFAEPLLGEGIYFSILGAQISAEVAAEACRSERFDAEFLRTYQCRCRSEFGLDFEVAFRAAGLTYLGQYDMKRVAQFFFGEKKVQECIVGLMDGSLRYRDARTKLAWPYFKYRLSKLGMPVYSWSAHTLKALVRLF